MAPVGRLGNILGNSEPSWLGAQQGSYARHRGLMLARYRTYRVRGTTLGDAANYCLTALATGSGGRAKDIPRRYSISQKVISTLGHLAASKGGVHARKAKGASAEFTPAERQWLEAFVVLAIRRAAQVAFDPAASYPMLTMEDLPAL